MKTISLVLILLSAGTAYAQEEPKEEFEKLFGTGVLRIFDIRDLMDRGPSAKQIAAHIRKEFAEGLKHVTPSKGRVLVIVATPEVQEKIRGYLAELRKVLGVVVTIESRFVALPVDAGNPPRFLDDAATSKFLKFIEMTEGASLVHAPTLTCYDGQQASIQIGAQVSTIADFDIERSADGSVLLDPVVERVFAGLIVELKPVVSHDRKYVTLIFEVRNSEVSSEQKPGEEEHGVRVSEVRESKIRTSVTLLNGRSVLLDLGRLPGSDKNRRNLVLVRAKAIVLDDEERDLFRREGEQIDLVPRKDK